ncbi:hypothetical protein AB1Y20_007060 [Prymnesium parvum]|uniref:Peptide-O-fucosyltransferase n=1 Tax=Prymnesium parvum TaxID=97485 RepID=A0AB34J085_PRYPA
MALCALLTLGQFLPDTDLADPEAPRYAGERCSWYDVRRLSWLSVRSLSGGGGGERDTRRWPRLGSLHRRPSSLPKPSVCDGYGARRVRTRCSECPGDTSFPREWSVLLCAPSDLTPLPPPMGAASPRLNVLLVGSDHNNHGLFAQVERVLNQLLLAENLGLLPHVFLGRKVHALPYSCAVGENQYFDHRRGANVWEYFFEPVSEYRTGNASLRGRPVRLLLANHDDARRNNILTSRDAVTSYFEFQRYDAELHAIRTRVRQLGARLVERWVRVRPEIRQQAAARLAQWRAASTRLLGVHLRGTDKVTHPKVPLKRFYKYVDLYLAAHPGARVLLATDDHAYHAAFAARYRGRFFSQSDGYETLNVVRDPAIPGGEKGTSALVDALLLAHTDFLLKSTSSLAEFALWYNPDLIVEHLDLQISPKAAESAAFRALVPTWAGGPREPPPHQPAKAEAMLARLAGGRTHEPTHPPAVAGVPARAAGVGVGRGAVARSPVVVSIAGGTCRDHPNADRRGRLRSLTLHECESYAHEGGEELSFIGANPEPTEFSGCVVWSGTHVEFNSAEDHGVQCDLTTKRGRCLCIDEQAN